MFDKTFTNPRKATVIAAFQDAIADANKGAKTRTIDIAGNLPSDLFGRKASNEGRYTVDGGGVCNTYRYRAETSAVTIAWWKSPNGKRYVRIVGDRVTAKSGSYGKTPDHHQAAFGWAGIFPERAAKLERLKVERVNKAIARRGTPEGSMPWLLRGDAKAIAASSKEGLMVVDNLKNPREVIVVVTCPSTGHAHYLTVPPKYADPKTKTYQSLGTPEARVHAAIAWTFNLKPEEYQVTIAS